MVYSQDQQWIQFQLMKYELGQILYISHISSMWNCFDIKDMEKSQLCKNDYTLGMNKRQKRKYVLSEMYQV